MVYFQRMLQFSSLKKTILLALVLVLVSSTPLASDTRFIIVQSTTSTQNSGLLDAILPQFTEKSGIAVRVVAVGTGQAIRNAVNGDGDVLLVHAKEAEEEFVTSGFGLKRYDVMYNDFVLVGPAEDPAQIENTTDAIAALSAIAGTDSIFASRGDDSGTHKAELRLWKAADIDAPSNSGGWYRETGSGMGATLNFGIATNAYVLTDRATWIAFGNKGSHKIMVEGDDRLFNQYGAILVNPDRHPSVKAADGQTFIDWLTHDEGQTAIEQFAVDGQQLFFPNSIRAGRN